ncbi:hypothetical protein AAFF_G00099980 [Aldrovandia affinis]|uniref:Uncharacterized protein n=1 Tax=Aldrovandia affinis TaxID=143900 RepID=A0AAD7WBC1_9TELE|nr:hypothetical protein AAFF_G00099980 [Aldrovandia affinis]
MASDSPSTVRHLYHSAASHEGRALARAGRGSGVTMWRVTPATSGPLPLGSAGERCHGRRIVPAVFLNSPPGLARGTTESGPNRLAKAGKMEKRSRLSLHRRVRLLSPPSVDKRLFVREPRPSAWRFLGPQSPAVAMGISAPGGVNYPVAVSHALRSPTPPDADGTVSRRGPL